MAAKLLLWNPIKTFGDQFGYGHFSSKFCDSETIKAIFEFVQCTVFEIFEVKDHSWGNATLQNFNKTKICKKTLFKNNYLKNYNDLNFETYEIDR
ncbi:hypothetical protein BLOT_014206 [Blomia tropicalis]|nr:hypothetical protein BLOT_014206 [Blomia tropicalis]